jgi:hypothetical protein
MTDDERLAALFRAAATDTAAPPPRFDRDDVVAASRRITARRRSAMAGGALTVLAVLGIGAVVAIPGSSRDDATSTAAAPFAASGQAGPGDAAAPDGAAPELAAPVPPAGGADVPQALRGVPPFTGTPLGPGTAECADRQDPALRAFVEQVLPEVVGAPEAATTMECRPGGERGVNVEVRDGDAAGLLTVQYLPPGVIVSLVSGAVSAPTASGGTVVVYSRPAETGAPVPFAGRVDTAAAFLAPRL